MVICCAYGCRNIGTHIFPKDLELKKKWEHALKKKTSATKYTRLCSAHFKPEDFKTECYYSGVTLQNKMLKKGVVPSVFPSKKAKKKTTRAETRKMRALAHKILRQVTSSKKSEPESEVCLDEVCYKVEVISEEDQIVLPEISSKDNKPEHKKTLLLKSPRISKIKPSNLQQTSQYDGEAEPEQPPSASGNILPSLLQVFVSAPVHNEEPTLAGYCRLCAASGLKDRLVDMKNDTGLRKLVVNMSTRLNTNIDFTQEHLPTTICSACIKALYTAYDFVVGIDLAEVTLNKILSAQKLNDKKPEYLSPVNHVDLPHTTTHTTTHQITIKPEVVDEEQPPLEDVPSISIVPELSPKMEPESDVEPEKQWINVPSITAPVPVPQPSPEKPDNRPATNDSCAPSILESRLTIPIVFNPLREQYRQIEVIDKKRQIIDKQKKKIKVLNQKVRRLQDRNVSLKNILKKLHKHTNSDAESDD